MIYSKFLRFIQFKMASENPSVTMEELGRAGRLMSKSHTSCRDFYKCNCPELDELAVLCLNSVSYGTRLM